MTDKRNTVNVSKNISTVHTGKHAVRQIGKSPSVKLTSVYQHGGYKDGCGCVKPCKCNNSIDDIIKPKR